MKLTDNFKLSEFESGDGAKMPDDVLENIKLLANELQLLRDYVDKPITVNSGYRSAKYNQKIGGAEKSQHVLGKAADIKVKGFGSYRLYRLIDRLIREGKMREGGLGYYNNFVHYDIRGQRARWNG